MIREDWDQLKHFFIHENWGCPEKMDFGLLKALDIFRERIDKPFIVNCGYATSGHSPNSYHYKGEAVDGRFKSLNIFDQFFEALKEDSFKGVGLYIFENRPFLHLDIRKRESKLIWYRDREGIYHYDFGFETLKSLSAITIPTAFADIAPTLID